jgi:hypothetical protein
VNFHCNSRYIIWFGFYDSLVLVEILQPPTTRLGSPQAPELGRAYSKRPPSTTQLYVPIRVRLKSFPNRVGTSDRWQIGISSLENAYEAVGLSNGLPLVHKTATMQSPETIPAPHNSSPTPQPTNTTLQRLHLKTNSVHVNFSSSLKVISCLDGSSHEIFGCFLVPPRPKHQCRNLLWL